jgi:hypothetical protein
LFIGLGLKAEMLQGSGRGPLGEVGAGDSGEAGGHSSVPSKNRGHMLPSLLILERATSNPSVLLISKLTNVGKKVKAY